MLLRLTEQHERPDAQRYNSETNSSTHSSMNVLAVTDFRNRRDGNCNYILFVSCEPNLTGFDLKLQTGAGLKIRYGAAVICDSVAVVASAENRRRHKDAQH